MKIGDRYKVFDPILWGGKDSGNNNRFFKAAIILEIDPPGPRQTAVVKFDHDNRTSRGHFTDGFQMNSSTE